jgi:hypothetical protein
MRLRALFLMALLGISLSSVYAAEFGDLINGQRVEWASRPYRVSLAKSIGGFLMPLRASVPSLSPEESRWLASERARISQMSDKDAAYRQLANLDISYPAEIDKAQRGFDATYSAIDCVVSRPQSEMSCWAMLSTSLLNSETFNALQRLHRQGKLAVAQEGPVGLITKSQQFEWSYWPSILAKGVIEYLVTPSIRQYELSTRTVP